MTITFRQAGAELRMLRKFDCVFHILQTTRVFVTIKLPRQRQLWFSFRTLRWQSHELQVRESRRGGRSPWNCNTDPSQKNIEMSTSVYDHKSSLNICKTHLFCNHPLGTVSWVDADHTERENAHKHLIANLLKSTCERLEIDPCWWDQSQNSAPEVRPVVEKLDDTGEKFSELVIL